MKKLLALFLSLALLVGCSARFEGYEFPQAVKVVTPLGSGSGAVIEQGVLTAEHVISALSEGGEDYYVLTTGGTFSGNTYFYRGGVGANDRAVLNVDTGIRPAMVYCGPLKTGERVIHVGYPGTGEGRTLRYISYGRISSTDIGNQGDYSNMVSLDIAADAGSSGGPVFNMKGEVIGVVVAVGRGHYGSLWATLMARPPAEVCPDFTTLHPVISNEVP